MHRNKQKLPGRDIMSMHNHAHSTYHNSFYFHPREVCVNYWWQFVGGFFFAILFSGNRRTHATFLLNFTFLSILGKRNIKIMQIMVVFCNLCLL